jgi:hypothetical protein
MLLYVNELHKEDMMMKKNSVIMPDASNLIAWDIDTEEPRYEPEGYEFEADIHFDHGGWVALDRTPDLDRGGAPVGLEYDISNDESLVVSDDLITGRCRSLGEGSCELLSVN